MENLASMNIYIRCLSANATRDQRLMHMNTGMWQRAARTMVTSHQQDRAKTGRHTYAGRSNRTRKNAHRIIDGQAGCHRATRRIDVDVNLALTVLRGQEQQLS